MRIRRFLKPEMKGWPKKDADYILYIELVLMFLFLTMNASDYWFCSSCVIVADGHPLIYVVYCNAMDLSSIFKKTVCF